MVPHTTRGLVSFVKSPGNPVTLRSTAPTQRNPVDGSRSQFRSGILTIYTNHAEELELPPGVDISPVVRTALASTQTQGALSASPSSVAKGRLAKQRGRKDRVQKIGYRCTVYLVMGFEVSQIVPTPLGGGIKQLAYVCRLPSPPMRFNADAHDFRSGDVSSKHWCSFTLFWSPYGSRCRLAVIVLRPTEHSMLHHSGVFAPLTLCPS